MTTSSASIAYIGIIGRNNNPLHTTILSPIRTPLQFSLLLSSTIDIFEMRAKSSATSSSSASPNLTGELGLLHAVDDRLAAYGFETNTGVRFVVVVDVRAGEEGTRSGVGLRDADVRPVFKALQSAYVALLQNPFYDPDEHTPPHGQGGKKITSRRFSNEVRRIGEKWRPGVTVI
ncbi:hypothetical protein jhhlp_006692 [Lomentospora prolificans]|uniref:Sedlin n=1 Tax=Lomentospora prolificans TaxID=41688 RepID=A0A2N3N4Y8_9PEZI|nr:hypothetical protein jhhlp_006102 [Lomentospora prolificans]PKS08080.1 hypothetical protein jhhlp_006692 [Lomentospora prolificans]